MKFCESGAALTEDLGVPFSTMQDSIEAHHAASLETAKDLDGGPYPACSTGKSMRPRLRPAGVHGELQDAANDSVVSQIDIFVSSSGKFNTVTLDQMKT